MAVPSALGRSTALCTNPTYERARGFFDRVLNPWQTDQPGRSIAMIARMWHGTTPIEKSSTYLALMRDVALPDYRSTPGNKGAYVLHNEADGVAHFVTLTFWESEQAVAAFAGADVTVAKYYDFDRDYLLDMQPRATHYDCHEG